MKRIKKITDYVLIATAVVNIVLASVTAVDVKLNVGNKMLDIILVFIYMIITILISSYLYSNRSK